MKRNELPKERKTLWDNCGCCCRRNILGYKYTREVNCIAYTIVVEWGNEIPSKSDGPKKEQQLISDRFYFCALPRFVVVAVVFFSLCLRFLYCYRADVVCSCDPSRNNDAKTRRFCCNEEVWWWCKWCVCFWIFLLFLQNLCQRILFLKSRWSLINIIHHSNN